MFTCLGVKVAADYSKSLSLNRSAKQLKDGITSPGLIVEIWNHGIDREYEGSHKWTDYLIHIRYLNSVAVCLNNQVLGPLRLIQSDNFTSRITICQTR